MNNLEADYVLLGQDLTGFWLQPGFVEGIIVDQKSFSTLVAAYRHIFRRNLEYAVLLWNGIPIRLSYIDDLPEMVLPLIELLHELLSNQPTISHKVIFQSSNLSAEWQVDADAETVTVNGHWQFISGGYEEALNQLGIVRMSRPAFLYEWKLLLQQLSKAISDAEATLTEAAACHSLEALRQIESQIACRGRFYRYGENE